MSSSKKIETFIGTEPHTPPPLLAHCRSVYGILINTRKGRIIEPERRLEGTPAAKSLDRSFF
jgi:hypothetical protein